MAHCNCIENCPVRLNAPYGYPLDEIEDFTHHFTCDECMTGPLPVSRGFHMSYEEEGNVVSLVETFCKDCYDRIESVRNKPNINQQAFLVQQELLLRFIREGGFLH